MRRDPCRSPSLRAGDSLAAIHLVTPESGVLRKESYRLPEESVFDHTCRWWAPWQSQDLTFRACALNKEVSLRKYPPEAQRRGQTHRTVYKRAGNTFGDGSAAIAFGLSRGTSARSLKTCSRAGHFPTSLAPGVVSGTHALFASPATGGGLVRPEPCQVLTEPY